MILWTSYSGASIYVYVYTYMHMGFTYTGANVASSIGNPWSSDS